MSRRNAYYRVLEVTNFITNAGEGVEKREPSYTVGGNVNWCSRYGEQYEGSSKTKNRVAI